MVPMSRFSIFDKDVPDCVVDQLFPEGNLKFECSYHRHSVTAHEIKWVLTTVYTQMKHEINDKSHGVYAMSSIDIKDLRQCHDSRPM